MRVDDYEPEHYDRLEAKPDTATDWDFAPYVAERAKYLDSVDRLTEAGLELLETL